MMSENLGQAKHLDAFEECTEAFSHAKKAPERGGFFTEKRSLYKDLFAVRKELKIVHKIENIRGVLLGGHDLEDSTV